MKRKVSVRLKTLMSTHRQPCLKCGDARWKTKEKNRVYECKSCGSVRVFKDEVTESHVREGME